MIAIALDPATQTGSFRDMDDDVVIIDADILSKRRRHRRWIYAGLGLVMVAPLAIGVLWAQRKPIAHNYLQNYLEDKGIKAQFDIKEIGTRFQRIENLVLGDPRNPDLTAEWAEIDTVANFSGINIGAIRAKGVRLRGQYRDGKISFGALDQLRSTSTKKSNGLPDMDVMIADARVGLDTDFGQVGLRFDGKGNFGSTFIGKLALTAPSLIRDDCVSQGAQAWLDLGIKDKKLSVKGPVRAATIQCGETRADGVALVLDGSVNDRFESGGGFLEAKVAQLSSAQGTLNTVNFWTDFGGNTGSVSGKMKLDVGQSRLPQAQLGMTAIGASYQLKRDADKGWNVFANGTVNADNARPDAKALAKMTQFRSAGDGTPAAPLVTQLSRAVEGLERGSRAKARFDLAHQNGNGRFTLNGVEVMSKSGAVLTIAGRDPVRYLWRDGGLMVEGQARLQGGGFPASTVSLASSDGRFSGTATIAPLTSGQTRLALSPVRFDIGPNGTSVNTTATFDGAINGIKLAGLQVPLSLTPGASPLNGCRMISLNSLVMTGVSFDPLSLNTCITGNTVQLSQPKASGRYQNTPFRFAGQSVSFDITRKTADIAGLNVSGSVNGSTFSATANRAQVNAATQLATIDAPEIKARYGKAPVVIKGQSAVFAKGVFVLKNPYAQGSANGMSGTLVSNEVRYDTNRQALSASAIRLNGRAGRSPFSLNATQLNGAGKDFALQNAAVSYGEGASKSALTLSQLKGRMGAGGASGNFTGGLINIANVPVNMERGTGQWRINGWALSLNGVSLALSDRLATPRYVPMQMRGFGMSVSRQGVKGTGSLFEPTTGTRIGAVDLDHSWLWGNGGLSLTIPGLTFTPELQPEQFTSLTKGTIANVAGTVKGTGNILWSARDGVWSTGRFSTDGMDLAADFGPVRQMKGAIEFDDLLNLVTAPGQSVEIAEINSGVQVTDGLIKYQLLPGLKAKVEGGRWPFSGGELFLEPTILDLSETAERRLTFRVVGLDAAKFINQLELENIAATGTFDGVLPMVFDSQGGRIEAGNMIVRDEGGTLSYISEVSQENLGTYGMIAFDALKSLKYKRLSIDLGGPLDGEMVTKIRLNGVNQNEIVPGRERYKLPIPIKVSGLTGVPFLFNITIKAPFRRLIKIGRDFQNPTDLIKETVDKERARLEAEAQKQNPDNPIQP
jgi:hypothetical protein